MTQKNIVITHHGRQISGKIYFPNTASFPMVIFSHGFNGIGDDFKGYADVLTENGIGACVFDFCGGSLRTKSSLTTTEMTIFTEKEDLCAVMDFAEKLPDVTDIFLFGASMGGLVSVLCAEELAAKIQGMILLYPALCIADDWNNRFPNAEEIPDVYSIWDVPLGKSFFETLHGFNVLEHIGKFKKDVLIIHGDKDSVVSLEYSRKANKLYENSTLEVFQGEGHGFSPQGDNRVANMTVHFVAKNQP